MYTCISEEICWNFQLLTITQRYIKLIICYLLGSTLNIDYASYRVVLKYSVLYLQPCGRSAPSRSHQSDLYAMIVILLRRMSSVNSLSDRANSGGVDQWKVRRSTFRRLTHDDRPADELTRRLLAATCCTFASAGGTQRQSRLSRHHNSAFSAASCYPRLLSSTSQPIQLALAIPPSGPMNSGSNCELTGI